MILLAGHVKDCQYMCTIQIKEITRYIQFKVSISTKQLTALNYVMENIESIIEALIPTNLSPNHTLQKET